MKWFVNGEPVDDTLVRAEARAMRPRYQEAVSGMDPIQAEMQLREWARENVIERMLLRHEALADPEPVPADIIDKALDSMKNTAGGMVGCGARTTDDEVRLQAETQYRIERLVGRIQGKVGPPKSKEVGDYYKKHRDRFWSDELVHAAHIVKNVDEQHDEATARAAIEQAKAELHEGADFAGVADRYSDCPGNGGDLGWFPRGEMVEEFDQAVFNLPVGSTSEIFRSVFGFHIAKVIARKPAGIRSFGEVKDGIEQALWQEKRQKALEAYLDRLRAKAEVRQEKEVSA
jgi:hypothetical protein